MSIHFDTKHIAEAIKKRKSGSRLEKRSVANPERAWLVACASFVVFFLASVWVSVWWYQHIQSLSLSVENNYQSTIPHYSAILVDEVHRSFGLRREKFNTLISKPGLVAEEDLDAGNDESSIQEQVEVGNNDESISEEEVTVSSNSTSDEGVNIIEEEVEASRETVEVVDDRPSMTDVTPEF